MSAVHTRRSSDRTPFVSTQPAKYLCSLLICNVVQAVGGLLNITWIVEARIYVGVACTAQGVTKQIGNVWDFFPLLPRRVSTHASLSSDWSRDFHLCNWGPYL